jgi:hypothetical protein
VLYYNLSLIYLIILKTAFSYLTVFLLNVRNIFLHLPLIINYLKNKIDVVPNINNMYHIFKQSNKHNLIQPQSKITVHLIDFKKLTLIFNL